MLYHAAFWESADDFDDMSGLTPLPASWGVSLPGQETAEFAPEEAPVGEITQSAADTTKRSFEGLIGSSEHVNLEIHESRS